ncbi:MAG: glycosyltransferase [Propionicimonas sp.]|nr:glycosyltransferase [Propionicimonas sp.]
MGVIHVFPDWRENPYLNMLYLGARAEGWQVDGSIDLPGLLPGLAGLRGGDVFHLHWTSPVCDAQATARDARAALDAFRGAVDAALREGVRLVWTIHNLVAHDSRYPDLEVELAEFLADRATAVIQLNPCTVAAAREFYLVPTHKVRTLRHASYLGIYPPAPSRQDARESFDLAPTRRTVGFVGRIRPYKGIETLLAAVGLAAREVDGLTLLLAGRTDPAHKAELDKLMPAGVPVVSRHSFVPDADLGRWFSACDVMAFPYQRILNSGSLLLSATYGKPCILPAEPHLVGALEGEDWVTFFSPGARAAESLAEAIVAALGRPTSRPGRSARRFAGEYTAYDMAWDYVRLLEELPGLEGR